jgi:phage terminase large subunit-like protein
MLPKGNAKTTLMAALAVWHLLTVRNANVFVGAATKLQADELFRFAAHFIESEPELGERLLLRRSTREVRSLSDQGFIRVLASDDSRQGGKAQGYNPTLALVDELHAHETDSLYIDLRSGLFKNRGLLVTITTAGHDQDSVLGQLRQGFLDVKASGGKLERDLVVTPPGMLVHDPAKGRLTIARAKSGRTVMLEWASREDDQPDDFATVKLANPASFVSEDSLQDAYEAPGITPWAYARYRMNRWTLGYESWLPEGAWGACEEYGLELEAKGDTVGALDMARYRDCAALSLIQRGEDGAKALKVKIWRSGGEDDPIRYEPVKQAIRDAHAAYDLRAVGYDPKYFDQAAEELAAEGIAMESFPQSNERMCPAWADLRSTIIGGEIRHDGDPELAAHMTAGKTRDVGPNAFRVEQPRRGVPIDGASATAMANALAQFELGSMYDDEGATI